MDDLLHQAISHLPHLFQVYIISTINNFMFSPINSEILIFIYSNLSQVVHVGSVKAPVPMHPPPCQREVLTIRKLVQTFSISAKPVFKSTSPHYQNEIVIAPALIFTLPHPSPEVAFPQFLQVPPVVLEIFRHLVSNIIQDPHPSPRSQPLHFLPTN